ncbi:MAG: hypothetical protein WC614_01600 [bacterium]
MTFLSDLGRIEAKRHTLGKVLKKEFMGRRGMLWMASVKRILVSLAFPSLLGDVLNDTPKSI